MLAKTTCQLAILDPLDSLVQGLALVMGRVLLGSPTPSGLALVKGRVLLRSPTLLGLALE
jgi:hypothetical protein